jgi:hypothetical protein
MKEAFALDNRIEIPATTNEINIGHPLRLHKIIILTSVSHNVVLKHTQGPQSPPSV